MGGVASFGDLGLLAPPAVQAAQGPPPLDEPSVPTRVRVPSLGSTFPSSRASCAFVATRRGYPLCDVAQYWSIYDLPGAPGTTWIYGHAQPGMFLPLLENTLASDGRGLLGKLVTLQLRDGRLLRYRIEQVKQHALDRRIARRDRPSRAAAHPSDQRGPARNDPSSRSRRGCGGHGRPMSARHEPGLAPARNLVRQSAGTGGRPHRRHRRPPSRARVARSVGSTSSLRSAVEPSSWARRSSPSTSCAALRPRRVAAPESSARRPGSRQQAASASTRHWCPARPGSSIRRRATHLQTTKENGRVLCGPGRSARSEVGLPAEQDLAVALPPDDPGAAQDERRRGQDPEDPVRSRRPYRGRQRPPDLGRDERVRGWLRRRGA